MITLKQFNGSRVNAVDDANFYYMLLQSSGILSGLSVTLTGTNQLNITAGYGFASGRMFYADADSVNAALAPSGTQKGRLYIHIDLANETAPAQFLTVAAATLPALVQEDLTGSGSIFDIPLIEYTVSAVQVSGLSYVAPSCSLAGVRDNLLINTNFLHPVNQRGQASYNTANKYGCDRWRLASGSSMSTGDTGLTVTGSIMQPIEGLAAMEGQTFVLSAKQAGRSAQSISGILSNSPVHVNSDAMSFSISGTDAIVTLGAGTWEWVKFEVGEYASAYSPRPYADELAMCRRYYQTFPGKLDTPIIQYKGGTGYAYHPIEEMRVTPSVSCSTVIAYKSTDNENLGAGSVAGDSPNTIAASRGGVGAGAYIEMTDTVCDAEIY